MNCNSTNLCFKNLPTDFEKQDLLSLCMQYGCIHNAKIMFDLKTGKSKGLGFVCYESPFSAALAKEKLNGKWISKLHSDPLNYRPDSYSKKINVSYAVTDGKKGRVTNTLIVSSLPLYYRKKEIYDLFSKYGMIEKIHLIIDSKRKTYHGKASIVFKTNYDAENAFKNLNNIKLMKDSWPLFIQFDDHAKNNDTSYKMTENRFGIEINKPKKRETIVEVHEKDDINNQNKINDENYYRDLEMEIFMFKMIAEED